MIMKLEEVVQKIKENEDILKERFKVKSIGIFGSLAREEDIIHDVDVILEFSEPIGWEIVDLKEFLEDLLGVRVDILTKKAVMSKPLLWKSIEREIVYV
ncbi:MAG: nucleotidyltransferase domain-containing protein [Archaeoglobi archaeon]|nr:nucleotidyltransferase domain-containing protein [Candidatus Mnemosynella sp.]